jgi:hypothetical protein
VTDTTVIDDAYALAVLDSARGYLAFLDHVVVDAQPVKLPFRHIAEPWQWERAERSAGAVDHLCGIPGAEGYAGVRSFWEGYHKGSDKTHEDARQLLFLLGWSRRALNCYVCAGSEDQAALITTAMRGIIRDNPWIGERVRVTELKATGVSGSTLTILPKNAYSGQGIFPDYVVASEITHWVHDDGYRMWEFVLESVNKRPHCVLKVETNAGLKGTWQWAERNRVAKSPFWGFYEAPVGPPLATWMNQDKIDDDSQGLTPGERDRLYKNRWVDPGEEHGYLTEAEALLCRDPALWERDRGDRYLEYYAVVDYGGVNDRCALGVVHAVPGTDRAVVDRLDCWQGTHAHRVAINYDPVFPNQRSVEGWLQLVLSNFRIAGVIVDPHQLEGLAVKYERRGVAVHRFEYRGGKANYRLAQLLKTSVQNRKVSWSPTAGLLPPEYVDNGRVRAIEDTTFEQELATLITKPTQWGYRIDHESGRHDDRAVAVGMALMYALPGALPEGDLGPKVAGAVDRPHPYGTQRTNRRDESGNPSSPAEVAVGRWNLLGLGAGGSSWDRGDI